MGWGERVKLINEKCHMHKVRQPVMAGGGALPWEPPQPAWVEGSEREITLPVPPTLGPREAPSLLASE